jgi:hypothetical protein
MKKGYPGEDRINPECIQGAYVAQHKQKKKRYGRMCYTHVSEPPLAERHGRWCGRGQDEPALYPILEPGKPPPARLMLM